MARQIQTRENGALGIYVSLLLLGGIGTGVWYFFFRKKDPAESVREYLSQFVDPSTIQIIKVEDIPQWIYDEGDGPMDERGVRHPLPPKGRGWFVSWMSNGQGGVALAYADGKVINLAD